MIAALAGLALAACSGNTNLGATRASDTGATLQAVPCDSSETCAGDFRWRARGDGRWVNGPSAGSIKRIPSLPPRTPTIRSRALGVATTYDSQSCWRGSTSASYVCAGANPAQPSATLAGPGSPNHSSNLTTLPFGTTTVSAQQFHDSIGVNVKETWWNTIYGDWTRTLADLNNIGIGHIRTGIYDSNNAGWNAYHWGQLRQAVAAGMKLNLVIEPDCSYLGTPSDAHLSDCFAAAKDQVGLGGVESFEWPNEYDISGDPNWAANLATWGHQIFSLAKALGPYRVYGPSIVYPADVALLGDQSSYLDYGNFHDYRGATSTTPVSVQLERARMWPVAGAKPDVATEFGYHNALSAPVNPGWQPGIDDQGAAVYVLRQYLEHLSDGLDRSYLNQLYDLSTSDTNSDQRFGLIRADGTYKPAAIALKNLVAMIGTGGPAALAPLSWGVDPSDQTSDLRSLDVQKSDGSHDLVLWRTASVWNRDAQQDLTVPPVMIHVDGSFAAWQSGDPVQSPALADGSGQIAVAVGADPVLVHIVPSSPAVPVSPGVGGGPTSPTAGGGPTSPTAGAGPTSPNIGAVGSTSSSGQAASGVGSTGSSHAGANTGSKRANTRAPCARLRSAQLERCQALESYHRAMGRCVYLKHGRATRCRNEAKTAYKRTVALIACEPVRNRRAHAGCVRKARRTR
jgi:hypothetical protein